jgi:hypothetical protein
MTNLSHGNCLILQLTCGRSWLNKFVISTGVVMGLRSTRGDEKRLPFSNHFPWSVALPFVIPSAAEGSAVPRTSPGNVFRPKRTRISWKEIRGSVVERSAVSLRLSRRRKAHQFEIVLCSTFSMCTSLTLRDMAILKSSTFFSSNIGEFAAFGVLIRKNSAPFTLSR